LLIFVYLVCGIFYEWRSRLRLCFHQYPRLFVNFKTRINTENSRVRFGIRWKAIEIKPVQFVCDPQIQRLKLITLESLCLLGIVVKKLYNDLLLLNVDDPESLVRVG